MPHRHPALLVGSIADVEDRGGIVMCAPQLDGLDVLQLIEAAAQALAALAATRATRAAAQTATDPPRSGGMLLAVNRVRSLHPALRGMDLAISCQTLTRLGALSAHQIIITDRDRTILTGEWSVMSQDAAPAPPAAVAAEHSVVHAAGVHAMRPLQDAAGALSERQSSDGNAEAKLCFPAELPVLSGHFPGNPVAPGVHLLAAVLLTAAPGARLIAVERSKWRRPLLPGEPASVHARWRREGDRLHLTGHVDGPAGRCCDCSLEALTS